MKIILKKPTRRGKRHLKYLAKFQGLGSYAGHKSAVFGQIDDEDLFEILKKEIEIYMDGTPGENELYYDSEEYEDND